LTELFGKGNKLLLRRYGGLIVMVVVDKEESELGILDLI
jgi:hypothetical protein